MPIMRCPACGKPNPDFLDVCQYCEAPLHPAGAAASPATPPALGPADETLIGGGAATVRCQACGRSNPGHLDVCQYCQARLTPLRAAGSPAATTGPAADDSPAPGSSLMNRLRSMGAATPPPEPDPEPEPEEPIEPSPANWMSRLRGMTDSAEPPTGLDTAGAANEPDWMWTGGEADEPAAPASPAPAEPAAPPTEVTPGSPELPDWLRDPDAPALPDSSGAPGSKPRRKMTDWLNARPGNAPVEPPPVDEVPDWLKNLAGTTGTLPVSGPLPPDSPAARRAAAPPPPSGTTDLPDWLKNIRTSTPLGGSDDAAGPQASAAHRMQALPEWMRTGTIAGPEPLPDPDLEPPATPAAEAPAAVEPPAAAPEAGLDASAEAPGPEAGTDDMPAWLRAIITPGAADETIPVPAKPKKKKMTDWLGNQPPPPTEAVSTDADLPDWLKALSAGESAPPPAAPSISPVAEGLPDWLKPGGLPEPADEPLAPAADLPADDELPAWLRSAGSAPAEAAPPVAPTPSVTPLTPAAPPPPAPSEPVTATTAADLPDWLTALAPASATASAAAPLDLDNDTLDWLNTLSAEPAAPAPEIPAPPVTGATMRPVSTEDALDLGHVTLPAETPAWLDELAAASKAPPAAPPPAASAAPGIQATPEAELPEWLKTMRGLPSDTDPPPEEMPDWLRAMRGLPPLANEERQLRAAETAAFQQELAEAAPTPAETAAAQAEAEATLIRQRPGATATEAAALPAWLAAMRPVDIAQASAGQADNFEETLGVLAGMRGVLRAEPAVAQPHRAAPAVNRLAVSEMHSAHTRLLTDLQQSEAAAAPRRGSAARVAQYLERWVVFALLAAAILLAQFQLPGLFGPPVGQPPEAEAAYAALLTAGASSGAAGTLPRPVLVVFDYEAAQQGELNPAAAAILRQLLGEGVPVVGVSTRATGAVVGQQLLTAAVTELGAETQFSYTYGTHYLNLGFIPGGPIGLLQFASVPRSSFSADFTAQFGGADWVWNAPAVSQIEMLDQFSLIVLISGTPQATRSWVEQAQLNAPAVPMIAVVSAGAEPLVRPYLTTNPPQLAGLVVGLSGAAGLEQRMGRPAEAVAALPALGGGLLAAAVLITAGGLVFGLLGLIRRRR